MMATPLIPSAAPLFISTYPPAKCGIATFTHDLIRSVAPFGGRGGMMVISNEESSSTSTLDTRWKIERNNRHDYASAADRINASRFDVVNVQHEFGIFGGDEGGYLLDLLAGLRKPVVTTLHTVLASPSIRYRRRLSQVVDASDRVVVLTAGAVKILRDVYGMSSSIIRFIPHGIPYVPFVATEEWKGRLGLSGRLVLATFGLLGPSKGIEDMIDALPELVQRNPEIIYLIVGETHPGVIASHGESYRAGLERRVVERGLEGHVRFIQRYLAEDALVDLLKGVDIYVTPYPNPDQISSGTLALAAGIGKAIVATRFHYALDLLADGRGKIADVANPESLRRAVQELIDDPKERETMRRRTYEFTRNMTWHEVGSRYHHLFAEVLNERTAPRLLSRRATSPQVTSNND